MSFSARQESFESAERIVLKVGSRLLVDENGAPSQSSINRLIEQIHLFREAGKEVILVSSGAIGCGMSITGQTTRPETIPELQACAALGQARLMSMYETAASSHGFHCAQLLLTGDDVKGRKRHLNVVNCIAALLKRGVLPIVNENDSISVQEICFGENDYLAALVAVLSRSALTVLMTSTDGMYRRDENGDLAERISTIPVLNDKIWKMAEGTDGNQLSTGGMESKLRAAEVLMNAGEDLWIINGENGFSALGGVLQGQDIGTFFPGKEAQMSSNKRWLAYFTGSAGALLLDDGAVCALQEKGGSLLASGLKEVKGSFVKGDVIEIRSESGTLVGRGCSNYDSDALEKIKGLQSRFIKQILGYHYYDEVIHRDNLVVLN